MLRKVIEKIRAGMLRDMINETRWIYSYTSRYKKGIVVYILLGFAVTVLGLAASVASKYLIDAVTGHHNSVILRIAAVYAGFSLARIALNAVSQRVNAKLSIKTSNEIRADVFRRFLTVDWQMSLDYHSGDLLSRVSDDVNTVAGSVLGWIPSLIIGLAQFLATLTVILVYDPMMALIALLSAPVTVLLSRFFIKKMRTFGQEVRQSQAKLTAFYEESLQNLQAIKAFSLHDTFSSRLDALQQLYCHVSLDYNLFSVKTHLLMSTLGFVVSGTCFAWGVYRLWSGYISFGTMTLFIQLAGLVASSFSSLVSLVPSAISATISAGRIMAILDLPCEDLSADEQSRALIENAVRDGVTVHVDHVHFAYQNGRQVFRGFDLHAKSGEIIGIVSPSGGGKTTLIRMLLGLITPSEGEVALESGAYRAPLSPCMRPLISYVAQEKVIFSGTVADTLRMTSPMATDGQLVDALQTACAWDFVSQLPDGIHTPLGERGSGLSEGQIQRLAIARALLSDAPILLLDEATSALDIDTERRVLGNMLSSGKRRTVIVTTHRPTVLLSCTRVYAITEGCARQLTQKEIDGLTVHKA